MSSTEKSERSCVHPSMVRGGGGAISLPVIGDAVGAHGHGGGSGGGGKIRPSRNGKRRAIVLAIVQLLMIAHIVLWILGGRYGWFGGKTVSPVEPSESMEFVKNGAINAGLVFFVVALLSTLILGRWFCGWGCHIVMLQDLCGWMMKKCGVRPKVFRSRLLVYVPLLMAVYMFLMPAIHRLALVPLDQTLAASLGDTNWLVVGWREVFGFLGFSLPIAQMPGWSASWHLTTTEFWKTFPGVMIAVPFLLVCGFGTVYFLGAKGFCTYGCPYGGFFYPIDRLAPGKIRVTDACHQCGHCTAVCTSNVRVHEEVREFGMVVDPGCMKCLDCVSVCPNEALYFGFGAPGIAKGKAKHEAPRRKYDLSWGEEVVLALVFAVSFLSFRGDMVRLPLLMTAGVAAVITFMVWKVWRIVRDANVNLHQFQFKLKGSVRPYGYAFAALTAAVFALTVHSGVVNGMLMVAQRHDARVTIPQEVVFAETPMQMPDEMKVEAADALEMYRKVSRVGSGAGGGGISLFGMSQGEIDMRMARLESAQLDFAAAERRLRRAMERDGMSDRFAGSLVWVLRAQNRRDEAKAFSEPLLLEREEFEATMDAYVNLLMSEGNVERAAEIAQQRFAKFPNSLHSMRWVSLLYLQSGRIEDGAALIRRTIEIDPNNPNAYRVLAMALTDLGRKEEAVAELAKGLALAPDDVSLRTTYAVALHDAGRTNEAIEQLEKALEQREQDPQLHAIMSMVLTDAGRTLEAQVHQQRADELLRSRMQGGTDHQH